MSNFVSKMEKKFGKYATDKIPLIMIICYSLGYIFNLINPDLLYVISLNPYAILHGQVWRLFSWILIPPGSSNIFFLLLSLYFYYSISKSLNAIWGNFKFNLYIFGGVLFIIIGAFGLYFFDRFTGFFVASDVYIPELVLYGYNTTYALISLLFTTYYLNMSLVLAYASTFPDAMVIFIVIPLKMKVLGILYAVILIYEAWEMGPLGFYILAISMLNFIIFFFTDRKKIRAYTKNRRNAQRAYNDMAAKRERERKIKVSRMRPSEGIAKHKCCICGQTDIDNPDLTFRFCSKCEGNYEYCQNHLYTHSHKGHLDVLNDENRD